MADGEDQPQPLVGDRAHERVVVVVHPTEGPQLGLQRGPPRDEPLLAPQPVDRAVARGHDDPCRRVLRHAGDRPALQRDQERVLDGFLRPVEVAEDPRQDGDRLARLASEQAVDENVLRSRQDAAAEPALSPASIAS